MTLSQLIDEARETYRARILFGGVDSAANRTYYRLLTSLNDAVDHGVVDITLYLTLADFRLLCEGMGIDPSDAFEKQMQLTDDTPLVVPEREPPFSMFVGFGADGRQTPIPAMTDDAFVDWLRRPKDS